MATKIWYPERADRVALNDDSQGYVTAEAPVLAPDEDSWVVEISSSGGFRKARITYCERENQWEEVYD